MRAGLAVPFVDTRAADLVWTLDHPPVEPLAARSVRAAGLDVQMRVLGASHQVLVRGAPGTADLVETVACLPDRPGRLPERGGADLPGYAYRFGSRVRTLARADFADRVERLRRRVDTAPAGLLAAFPGDPLAVTALVLLPSADRDLSWRTWHAYPQYGELVTTTTSMTATPSPPTSPTSPTP